MKKSDLKTGMLIERNNGDLFQVFLDTPLGNIYINGEGIYGKLDYINENMCWRGLEKVKYVVKVYSPKYCHSFLSFDLDQFKLIWIKEPKETIQIGEITYDKAEFEEAVKNLKPIK